MSVLQAQRQTNPPEVVTKLAALRDYPRLKCNDIMIGKVKIGTVTVREVEFALDDVGRAAIPSNNRACHDLQSIGCCYLSLLLKRLRFPVYRMP